MIVVDTNVIAFFWMNGQYTESAKSLFNYDSDWVVPFLWRSEFRNVLAQYIRKKLLPLEQALEIMSEAENMFKEKEYAVKSLEVLDKISKSSLSAYDLEYVVLAETLEIKLVTMYKKIVKEFPKGAILLSDF